MLAAAWPTLSPPHFVFGCVGWHTVPAAGSPVSMVHAPTFKVLELDYDPKQIFRRNAPSALSVSSALAPVRYVPIIPEYVGV